MTKVSEDSTKTPGEAIRILIVTPGLNLCGGIESYCMNYYRHLPKNIHMDFVTHDIKDCNYKNEIQKNDNRVFQLSPFTLKNTLKTPREIKDFLAANHDYDIIHCHMANAAWFYLRYAKKYGIKVRILHSHQNKYADTKSHTLRNIPLVKLGKRYATHYFACSKLAGDFLFGKAPYAIIPNAIDLKKFTFNPALREEYRKKLNIANDEVLIGHVGRFCPQKNQPFIIDIFRQLAQKDSRYKLLLIGDGETKSQIQTAIKVHNLTSHVTILDSTPDIPAYLSAMDIFILPSIYEGLGIVAVEAQAAGLPCLLSGAIPPDAKLTDLASYLPLNTQAWTSGIISTRVPATNVRTSSIKATSYNIASASQQLLNVYNSLVREDS